MYNLSNELMDQPDIVTVKLVNKKVTFVHKIHWNALVTIGNAEAEWQLQGVDIQHKSLLKKVTSKGQLRADDPQLKKSAGEIGKMAAKLEERLLIYTESIHTDSGKHVRMLESWKKIMETRGHRVKTLNYLSAIIHLENLQNKFTSEYGGKVFLPWQK